nr:PWI domain mRNA processing protein [Aspergillus niger CBS 513.88]|eukprot:XP_001400291.2 PWI domain mRNA processing protein [Aspergillus niger CBS 513.88]
MATSVDAKLLKQTKFPPEFSRKVDMTKVNIEVMKKWIAGKISEILGNEDDVVIELCFNLLEGSRFPDIKSLQIQLTGFLDKDTGKFCKELWSLCLSAQENPQGVPKELLEAKKLELIQEKIEAERAAEEARKQKEQERARERELEDLRRRERSERTRGGRRGGGRGGRDFDRRRSPPRQRSRDRFRGPPGRREFDSYVPSGSRRGRRPSRSPSRSRSRSVSSSRSPPPRRRHPGNDRNRRRDAALITVIVQDPLPAVNHHAHVVPEETDGDGDPFLPAVHRVHLSTGIDARGEVLQHRGPVRGRKGRMVAARKSRDDRRLSRSRDRNDTRRRRYSSQSVSRSRSRGRSRSASQDSRSRSRSRSHSRMRDRKRRRSIERYAPVARRRRNTSSVSVPSDKRKRMADEDEDAAKRSPPQAEKPSSSDQEMKDATETAAPSNNPARVRISSSELREKLLREKIIAMRRTASSDKVGSSASSR